MTGAVCEIEQSFDSKNNKDLQLFKICPMLFSINVIKANVHHDMMSLTRFPYKE